MSKHLIVLVEEETLDHTDELGHIYRRTGHCCQCGDCCLHGDPWNGELGKPDIVDACPKFIFSNGLGVCHHHDESNSVWKNSCSKWPTHPHQIADYPKCTYRIERVR